jgi:LytS/YehU family sensor histidine kinase
VLFTLGISALMGIVLSPIWVIPTIEVMARAMLVGLVAAAAFGTLERWPAKVPSFMARWALQVAGAAVAIPVAVLVLYLLLSIGDQLPFWRQMERVSGFFVLSFTGIIVASWMALAALIRQREEEARSQALAYELDRSELERKALDSHLRLLQAQVEPHFLFNTLANIRELVQSGSPQAPRVLDTLITYLRAAVPRLNDPLSTLGQEAELVRAYLELMQMRMPDRLSFTVDVQEPALAARCPAATLLTLVENAIRHGIDPSEDGGRIDVRVVASDGRVHAEVADTGVGLESETRSLGTGLTSLRERLQLAFGGEAQLQVAPLQPRGTIATVDFPLRAKPA